MEKKKKKKKVPMKKRVIGTLKQTGISTAAVAGGTGISAALGKFSPFAGLLMMGAGHFLGGKWHVLTVAGAATFGYGLAKSQENRIPDQSLKNRFVHFKEDWVHAFYLDKIIKASNPTTDDETVGAIDTGNLDHIIDNLEREARNYERSNQSRLPRSINEGTSLMDEATVLFDEEIDFSTL